MVVVHRLVDIIGAGGLPAFAPLFPIVGKFDAVKVVVGQKEVGKAELQQAVMRRAGEVWRASW